MPEPDLQQTASPQETKKTADQSSSTGTVTSNTTISAQHLQSPNGITSDPVDVPPHGKIVIIPVPMNGGAIKEYKFVFHIADLVDRAKSQQVPMGSVVMEVFCEATGAFDDAGRPSPSRHFSYPLVFRQLGEFMREGADTQGLFLQLGLPDYAFKSDGLTYPVTPPPAGPFDYPSSISTEVEDYYTESSKKIQLEQMAAEQTQLANDEATATIDSAPGDNVAATPEGAIEQLGGVTTDSLDETGASPSGGAVDKLEVEQWLVFFLNTLGSLEEEEPDWTKVRRFLGRDPEMVRDVCEKYESLEGDEEPRYGYTLIDDISDASWRYPDGQAPGVWANAYVMIFELLGIAPAGIEPKSAADPSSELKMSVDHDPIKGSTATFQVTADESTAIGQQLRQLEDDDTVFALWWATKEEKVNCETDPSVVTVVLPDENDATTTGREVKDDLQQLYLPGADQDPLSFQFKFTEEGTYRIYFKIGAANQAVDVAGVYYDVNVVSGSEKLLEAWSGHQPKSYENQVAELYAQSYLARTGTGISATGVSYVESVRDPRAAPHHRVHFNPGGLDSRDAQPANPGAYKSRDNHFGDDPLYSEDDFGGGRAVCRDIQGKTTSCRWFAWSTSEAFYERADAELVGTAGSFGIPGMDGNAKVVGLSVLPQTGTLGSQERVTFSTLYPGDYVLVAAPEDGSPAAMQYKRVLSTAEARQYAEMGRSARTGMDLYNRGVPEIDRDGRRIREGLLPTGGKKLWPVKAMHLSDDGPVTALSLFVGRTRNGFKLLDLTPWAYKNVYEHPLAGTVGLHGAFEDFRKDNKYPNGKMRVSFSFAGGTFGASDADLAAFSYDESFATDEMTSGEKAAGYLGYASMGLTVAGLMTLWCPPVSALCFGSASVTAALSSVVALQDNLDQPSTDEWQMAIDVVGLATSLLPLPAIGNTLRTMKLGASTSNAVARGGANYHAIRTAALKRQLRAANQLQAVAKLDSVLSGVEGIMIGAETLRQLEMIQNMPSDQADESQKLWRAVQVLMSNIGTVAGMYLLSNRMAARVERQRQAARDSSQSQDGQGKSEKAKVNEHVEDLEPAQTTEGSMLARAKDEFATQFDDWAYLKEKHPALFDELMEEMADRWQDYGAPVGDQWAELPANEWAEVSGRDYFVDVGRSEAQRAALATQDLDYLAQIARADLDPFDILSSRNGNVYKPGTRFFGAYVNDDFGLVRLSPVPGSRYADGRDVPAGPESLNALRSAVEGEADDDVFSFELELQEDGALSIRNWGDVPEDIQPFLEGTLHETGRPISSARADGAMDPALSPDDAYSKFRATRWRRIRTNLQDIELTFDIDVDVGSMGFAPDSTPAPYVFEQFVGSVTDPLLNHYSDVYVRQFIILRDFVSTVRLVRGDAPGTTCTFDGDTLVVTTRQDATADDFYRAVDEAYESKHQNNLDVSEVTFGPAVDPGNDYPQLGKRKIHEYNAADDIRAREPGNDIYDGATFFPGIYLVSQRKVWLTPGEGAKFADGSFVENVPSRSMAHGEILNALSDFGIADAGEDNVGFTIRLDEDGTISVTGWNSISVNVNNQNSLMVPPEYRQPIVELLQKQTGRDVDAADANLISQRFENANAMGEFFDSRYGQSIGRELSRDFGHPVEFSIDWDSFNAALPQGSDMLIADEFSVAVVREVVNGVKQARALLPNKVSAITSVRIAAGPHNVQFDDGTLTVSVDEDGASTHRVEGDTFVLFNNRPTD